MKPLFVTSLSEYSGKNLILLGLARRFQKEGYKVGLFKPFGVFPTRVDNVLTDEDTVFFKKVLGIEDSLADMCPCVINDSLIEDVLEGEATDIYDRIKAAYERIAKGKDVVLVESLGDFSFGGFMGAPFEMLVKEFGGRSLVIDAPKWVNQMLDGLVNAHRKIGDALLGAVVNKVKPGKLNFYNDLVTPYLKKQGIELLGIIGEDSLLSSVSVREVCDAVGGDVVCCHDKLDGVVEKFSIGAMNVESALRHMRKLRNQALIVGGDRADIQLAALETSTTCMILTGGLIPNEIILRKSTAAGVPILVVKGDTGTVVERVESLLGHLSLRSESKVARAVEIVNKAIAFDRILEGLK